MLMKEISNLEEKLTKINVSPQDTSPVSSEVKVMSTDERISFLEAKNKRFEGQMEFLLKENARLSLENKALSENKKEHVKSPPNGRRKSVITAQIDAPNTTPSKRRGSLSAFQSETEEVSVYIICIYIGGARESAAPIFLC